MNQCPAEEAVCLPVCYFPNAVGKFVTTYMYYALQEFIVLTITDMECVINCKTSEDARQCVLECKKRKLTVNSRIINDISAHVLLITKF